MKYDLGNITLYITKDNASQAELAASVIKEQIDSKPNSVMGFATGGTPVETYKCLIKMYEEGKIDFSKVVSFNLDEYYPIEPSDKNSYRYFMNDNLFGKINIKETNLPNGRANDAEVECLEYESKLRKAGYTDLQILGIGLNGHIAFNEPCEVFPNETHVVELEESTIQANARFFDDIKDVPVKAITMGIGSIMMSKKILLLASGANKAEIIKQTLFGDITPKTPSSALKLHRDVIVIITEDAAAQIKDLL